MVETPLDELFDTNENGEIEPTDMPPVLNELDELTDIDGDGFLNDEEFEVITTVDKIIDLNNDGTIESREIKIILEALVRGPHDTRPRNPIDKFMDRNKDGFIDDTEIWFVRDHLFIPHPYRECFCQHE